MLEVAAEGPLLGSYRDAVDLVGEALSADTNVVVIPVSRLGAGFFRLETRIAGEFLQKLLDYRLRVVIVGDIAEHLADSDSLRAFVYESNKGRQVRFTSSFETLEQEWLAGAR
ncbi:DUF4180 domain-containing protein [Amycolatopsis sp. NPDC059657]|uniref:DUF4180 domain-containing protein n=1 Tax=Amycolatopsis sp. NPDC059657 TaxID=3346899 RepID=UPI00366E8598